MDSAWHHRPAEKIFRWGEMSPAQSWGWRDNSCGGVLAACQQHKVSFVIAGAELLYWLRHGAVTLGVHQQNNLSIYW